MKTADETLAHLRTAATARKARFAARQAEAGIRPLHIAVPDALRDTFRTLAARARAGENITPPAAVAPTTPTDPETRLLLDAGRRIDLLLKRHHELNSILLQATTTPTGEFVAMLHTLFPAVPDTSAVALPVTLSVTVPDTSAVTHPDTQSVALIDTLSVAVPVALVDTPRRTLPAFRATPRTAQ